MHATETLSTPKNTERMKAPDFDLLKRSLGGLAFVCALGAATWRIPNPPAPAFLPPSVSASQKAPFFADDKLPDSAEAEWISLAQLGDGRIAAAWSRQEAHAGIRFSLLAQGGWLAPSLAATRESAAGALLARVGRLTSPVLYGEGGWLHLWYAGLPSDGDGRSILLHTRSTDGGTTWSRSERLLASPLAHGSVLPHGNPLPLADGGLGLSLSQDFPGHASLWLRLDPTGRVLEKTRLADSNLGDTPSLAALDERTAFLVGTATSPDAATLAAGTTADAGIAWQATVAALPPLNAQAPSALLGLPGGQLLLAANAPGTRGILQLWRSTDRGAHWQLARTVESAADGAADFSSPALLLARDGRIHLAYAWRRQAIRHLVFNDAWLDGANP